MTGLVDRVLGMNAEAADLFVSTIVDRRAYRAEHPTEIAISACMDGRIDVAGSCGIPYGIAQSFRNIGGRYRLGWPMMSTKLTEWADYAHAMYRPALFIATYHFSGSQNGRLGCRGFQNDADAARAWMEDFQRRVRKAFRGRIWVVVAGVDTDNDALLIHGSATTFDARTFARRSIVEKSSIGDAAKCVMGGIPEHVFDDVFPLLVANIKHVRTMMGKPRNGHDLDHRESVLAIGDDLEWLRRDVAIKIGDCDPALDDAIVTAAQIIQKNREHGRVQDPEGLLLVDCAYRRDVDHGATLERAKFLGEFALEVIKRRIPDMRDFFVPLVGVTSYDDRRFEQIA